MKLSTRIALIALITALPTSAIAQSPTNPASTIVCYEEWLSVKEQLDQGAGLAGKNECLADTYVLLDEEITDALARCWQAGCHRLNILYGIFRIEELNPPQASDHWQGKAELRVSCEKET